MRGWQCSRCNQLHTQNASKCRRCGHRVLSPASGEKLERVSDGIEGVDSVEVEHTVGTPDEYSVDSSPDVAVDGSIKGANESEEQQEDWGFFTRVLARLRSEQLLSMANHSDRSMLTRLRSVLSYPLRLNGRFILWWQTKIQRWSKLRTRGFTGWVLWEISWPLMVVSIILFYAYTIPWIIAGYLYENWWVLPVLLILGVAATQTGILASPLLS